MKSYLPSLIIAAVAGVVLWKLWPQLTAKPPGVEELASAITAANKAAADKAAADRESAKSAK